MVSKVLIQYWNVSFLYTMCVLYRVFRARNQILKAVISLMTQT